MLKIATGTIHADGTETRGKVATFPNLKAFCDALNAGSAPSTGKQKWGPYWSPFDAPRKKGEKPDWQVLVLDYDSGTPDWTNFRPFEHIRYQTPSSTPAALRWRVIVALDAPIPFVEVPGLVKHEFPGADLAALKPTQILWHRHPEWPAQYFEGGPFEWGHYVAAIAEMTQPDPEPVVTTPTMAKPALIEALYWLDPDLGYDDWLRAGMALHHEYGGSEEGFAEWLHWSERGAKFAGVNDLRSHWNSFKPGGGITGLSLLQMQTAKIDDFPIVTEAQAAGTSRFRVIPAGEFVDRPRPPWLIKGLLGGDLGVMYGESTAGKTFLAIDIAMAVGRGIQWRGHRTKQGRVVWLAAEDAYGVQQRQLAYCKHHGCPPVIDAIDASVLLTKVDDVRDLITAIGKADLVVVDTLARVNGADENDASEMSVLIRNCQAIYRATGAYILLIHHSGWDKSHMRGSSALRAAVDAEIRVSTIEGSDVRKAQATKVKGGPSGKAYGFKLVRVELGRDADGDPESSCVIVEASLMEKLTPKQLRVYEALKSMDGWLEVDVLDELVEREIESRKDNGRVTLDTLQAKGCITRADGKVNLGPPVREFETLESLLGDFNVIGD